MCETINVFDKAKLNKELANKLRKTNPVQMELLIKMHLSFLLNLTEYQDNEIETSDKAKHKKIWIFPKKKPSACTKTHSPETATVLLPEIMDQLMVLINFLQKDENLKQEGLFRKTGSVSRQAELKYLINQMKPFNLEEYTAHDVASVLKSILNDLPEPILSESYFPAYTQIAEICNSKENDEKERIKNSLQLIFLLLPSENKSTLENLVNLLYKASCMEAHNKMNADSLSTLFTPHLICPRKIQPESLHQMAATMTRMISFMIANAPTIFLVPENLATDIRAYFAEEKRRRETPEKVLDESIQSDSVASTVFTFVDRQKTAEENVQSTTDTALAALFAHIQSLPESSKKKKLIKQFNKQNGQGTPLQYINRDKTQSTCRSIGDSIKKHIFHKTLHKTPKRSTNTPCSSSKLMHTPSIQTHANKRILFQSPLFTPKPSPIIEITKPITETPSTATSTTSSLCSETSNASIDRSNDNVEMNAEKGARENQLEISQEEMIDDEDFVDSDEEIDANPTEQNTNQQPVHLGDKKIFLFKSRLIKGVSLGNLKFPFHTTHANNKTSPKMKKSKSSSMLIDIEKDEEKRKLKQSATESFEISSEESDLFFSMDNTKENWHVDVSNINYFLNQTEMQEQQNQGFRNSMSPITKSTQRMPKSMQESIMTPRSRKPVMVAMYGSSDPKSFQTNISQLLEESEEIASDCSQTNSGKEAISQSSSGSSIPISNLNILSQNDDMSAANDNGLPVISEHGSSGESLSSAFKEYLLSRGHKIDDQENDHDDDSFSSQSDDYNNSAEYQKLEESQNNFSQDADIDTVINQSDMSKSLLHCLDGNELHSSFERSRKRQLEDSLIEEESSTESLKKPLIEDEKTDF